LNGDARRSLRLVLCIALASGLSWAICHALGLGSAAPYGVVVAALIVRPRFDAWPRPVFVLLPLVVGLGLGLGTLLQPLIDGPEVWQFAVVTACAQILAQALPDRLLAVRNILAVLAVLPLMAASADALTSWHQLLAVLCGLATGSLLQAALRLPGDPGAPEPPPALPARSLAQRFRDPYFWRKLIVASLALSVGMGLGAVTPKYLYFGVVLLLNDSLGATLLRVRDRMVGVSLGVLMPWLVFNCFGSGSGAVTVALVMGGTAALMLALGQVDHLRTALISSGVTFVGYGALSGWYIPHRWLDYLLGCGLALLACAAVRPFSALARFRQLAADLPVGPLPPQLTALLPSALEEARMLGLERQFQADLEQILGPGGKA